MQLEIKTTYNDGSAHTVPVTPRDQVSFERNFNVAFASVGDDLKFEYIYFLAWSGLTRTGVEIHTFDDFLDLISDVEVNPGEEDDQGPLETA